MKTFLKAGAALMLGTAAPSIAMAQDNPASVNSVNDKRTYDALDEAQQAEYDNWNETYRTAYVGWPYEYQETFWTYPADYRTAYWSWPADYQSSYWTWPADYQAYYWDLTDSQQQAWWALTPDQREKILAMTPEQQLAAWDSINAQITAQQEPETVMASDTKVMDAPAPRTGEYPVCKGDVQDSCIQPREAGLNYGNVPLDYWPGEPASSQ